MNARNLASIHPLMLLEFGDRSVNNIYNDVIRGSK